MVDNLTISNIQKYIKMYDDFDRNKSVLFLKLIEEIGELAEVMYIDNNRKFPINTD